MPSFYVFQSQFDDEKCLVSVKYIKVIIKTNYSVLTRHRTERSQSFYGIIFWYTHCSTSS